MKKINIITVNNNGGLTRDAKILSHLLRQCGFEVSLFEVGKPTIGHKLHRITTHVERFVSYQFYNKPPYDINLFLQDVFSSWFAYARVNCLIPNQEWFRESFQPYLTQFDYILCKTKYAQSIFNHLECKTEFISFTSVDQFDEQYSKDYDKFFHVAGSNAVQKGTKTLIEVWSRHPEWPTLIVRQKKQGFHLQASNIDYIHDYLDEQTLRQYQNTFGIHLCPSQAEGFGHYIVEAMTTKALICTTNAPPMNELITSERGLLADYSHSQPQRLGMNYYVDPQALEAKIEEILDMDYETKKQLGENARGWYLDNDKFFQEKVVNFLKDL